MIEDEYKMPDNSAQGGTMGNPATPPEQAAKYALEAEQIEASVVGDNFGSIINNTGLSLADAIQLAKEMLSLGNSMAASVAFSSNIRPGSIHEHKRQLADIMGQELQDAAMDNDAATNYATGTNDPAAMPDEIDEWYYDKLDEYERSYVIAVAVLQGATANDITRKARELYQRTNSTTLAVGTMPARSASRIRRNTYTTMQESGDPRIFWKSSEFGPRILRFIAEESFEWPGIQPGQSFIDMLQTWPEELNGESARRAARMFGTILAYQSPNQLWRVANTWANRKYARDWRLAASLLNGAYEVGLNAQNNKSASILTNSVLQLLTQWSDRWLQSANVQVGCAAAHTYSLIGRRSPTIALQGLERLLQPRESAPRSSSKKSTRPRELASAIVSAYVTISLAGHIRTVLGNLAACVERLSHACQRPAKVSQYLQYKQQREQILDTTFETFFVIAASSLSAFSPTPTKSYSSSEALPTEPPMPDRNGRDILLTGLLTVSENQWRNNLTSLLCAAIIEGKSKPAFDLLLQWASIVLSQAQGKEETLYTNFITFMVNLGKTLHLWCNDLAQQGFNRSLALQAYENKLIAWRQEGYQQQNGIGTLAQYVLQLTEW
jgi:hypothetical protein